MESMKVSIERPKLTFVLEGEDLATFDFYEYDDAITNAYSSRDKEDSLDVVMVMKNWMHEHGLPSNVPYRAVGDWMLAVDRRLAELAKKAIGS